MTPDDPQLLNCPGDSTGRFTVPRRSPWKVTIALAVILIFAGSAWAEYCSTQGTPRIAKSEVWRFDWRAFLPVDEIIASEAKHLPWGDAGRLRAPAVPQGVRPLSPGTLETITVLVPNLSNVPGRNSSDATKDAFLRQRIISAGEIRHRTGRDHLPMLPADRKEQLEAAVASDLWPVN
jgi:hypothetical protein